MAADKRTYTDADIEAALVSTGRNLRDAASLLGCSYNTVWAYTKRIGVVAVRSSGRPWSLTPAQRERIAQLRESGKPFAAIAEEIGCSISATQWTCASLGAEHPTKLAVLPRRDPNRVSMRNGHAVRYFGPAEDATLIAKAMAGATPYAIGRDMQRATSSVVARLRALARREERAMA